MLEKIQKTLDSLQNKVPFVDYFSEEGFQYCVKKTKEITPLVHQMHKGIRRYQFESQADEIHFFKNLKPQLIKEYIFMNWLKNTHETTTSYCLQNPVYLDSLLGTYHQLFIDESEFYSYLKRGDTASDSLYFTRLKSPIACSEKNHYFVNFDFKINCSHGHLKAQLLAYEQIQICLMERINFLKKQEHFLLHAPSNLNAQWTGTKIEAVELIYALYYSKVLNRGELSVYKIAQIFDELLGTQLQKNIYRDLIDIKNRKTEPTKFLNKLQAILCEKIDSY